MINKEKIFICIPANTFTGGPTLAHQLCRKLIQMNIEASMLYYNYNEKNQESPVHENYKSYNLPYTLNIEDKKNHIFITTEYNLNLFQNIKYAKKIIWWMSVDNYWDCHKTSIIMKYKIYYMLFSLIFYKKPKPFNVKRKGVIHLAQCNYIKDFLINYGIKKSAIYPLSDYIEKDFFEKDYSSIKREDIILYNPKKGMEYTQKLIDFAPNLNWTPILGMSPQEVKKLMFKSKIYIDFGIHPGKDRLPREAALCGCCILTNLKGSARYYEDVPIPINYKFKDSDENIPIILNSIYYILLNFIESTKDFNYYRELIKKEEKRFEEEIIDFFKVLKKL